LPEKNWRFQRVWDEAKEPSQEAFGRGIGISGPMVSMIATGARQMTLDVARAISRKYGYRVAWLLEAEEPEKPNTSQVAALEQAYRRGVRETLAAFRRFADEREELFTGLGEGRAARAKGAARQVKKAEGNKHGPQSPPEASPPDRAREG
jgi:transcriptional regulator with XRE-family HTH domain